MLLGNWFLKFINFSLNLNLNSRLWLLVTMLDITDLEWNVNYKGEYFYHTLLKVLDSPVSECGVSSTMNPTYQDTEELPEEPVLLEAPQHQSCLISRFWMGSKIRWFWYNCSENYTLKSVVLRSAYILSPACPQEPAPVAALPCRVPFKHCCLFAHNS